MARVRAILAALWKDTHRNRKSVGSFSGNNLLNAGITLVFLQDTPALIFFLTILGLIVFFPLSSDPLRRIPAGRLALWPLTIGERRLLRVMSPWLNPLAWMLLVLLVWKRVSLRLWALVLLLFAVGFVVPSIPSSARLNLDRLLPVFPAPLNQLIRKNLREMFATLDFYAALIIAAPAVFCRLRGLLPAEALVPLTLLVVLAISTCAASLFALDGAAGLTRYRLMPIRGWQMLAAKDAAFLSVALLLTLGLSPLAGLAAALIALATGHHSSVRQYHPQIRWRFQTAGSFAGSLLQMFLMIVAGAGTAYAGALILVPCVVAYVISTCWFVRALERDNWGN